MVGSRQTCRMLSPIESFPYPAQFFDVGGHSLAFRDVGPTDTGASENPDRSILCVHGNPTWSFYYRRIIERFGPSRRVIAVDHLGCGESDKPSQSDFSYRLVDHQANLISLVESLDLKRCTLIAHDWGGAIGLGTLVALRERFEKIVLLNTGAFPPPYVPWRIRACRFPVLGTWAMRRLNLFARAAITMAMSRNRLGAGAAAGLLAPYHDWDSRVAIDAFVRDIPLSRKHPTFDALESLEKSLRQLTELPVLLVWGMKDWCFRPECLHRFQEIWPHAESVEIPDAGHYVLEDAPEETLRAIADFIGPDEARHD